jgi:hypothetical protein
MGNKASTESHRGIATSASKLTSIGHQSSLLQQTDLLTYVLEGNGEVLGHGRTFSDMFSGVHWLPAV